MCLSLEMPHTLSSSSTPRGGDQGERVTPKSSTRIEPGARHNRGGEQGFSIEIPLRVRSLSG